MKFRGYRRGNGSVGVRNHVLIFPTTICASTVAQTISNEVAGTVSAAHLHGCGHLGEEKEHFRVNDDGEPSNSAGKPILGQIQSKDLSNILIVVVRYFGGTLLGIGGLMQAYKTAAKEALESAKIIDKYIYRIYLVKFIYEEMNSVMKVCLICRLYYFNS